MLRIDEIISLAEPYKNYLSKVKIKEISHTLGIEESVIVGVLQHKHIVDYRKLNGYKRKVIELLPKIESLDKSYLISFSKHLK